MTTIYTDSGVYESSAEPRKRRAPARALRFAEIKIGDQLVLTHCGSGGSMWLSYYYLVTDLWFDPVAGQHDHVAGQMVAVAQLLLDGSWRRKRQHTKRGLASQGYRYADVDFIAQAKATIEAMKSGEVVGIGRGRVIRARPKLPSARF